MAKIIDIAPDQFTPLTWEQLVQGLNSVGVSVSNPMGSTSSSTGITPSTGTAPSSGATISPIATDWQSNNFSPGLRGWRLTSGGVLQAVDGIFSGEITATTGEIGGWTIGATTLTGTGVTLSSTGDAYLAIGTTPPTGVSTGTGIFINKTGLFGLDSDTQNFKIDATDGSITAIKGTIGGFTLASGLMYGGVIKTAETVAAGSNGVIMDTDGLRGYDSVLGNTFNLPTDGSAPTFSSGIINETVYEISTNAVLRTSETVGDGSANSAGILINNTGFYGCQASQTLANANLKALIDGTVVVKGSITISNPEDIDGSTITNDSSWTNDDTADTAITNAATAQTAADDAQSDASTAITNAATAQGTADGKVTTFYQDGEPTAEGEGDLWVDTNDGNKLYRWSGSSWTEVQDDDIATAISNASTAQSTADGKIVTFYQSAIPTATDAGDFFFDTDDGKMYRSTNIGDDQITAGEWERIDTGLTPELIDALQTTNAPADAGATAGATWGTDLNSIPATLGTPSGTGLFLSSTHLGYYDTDTWKTYMDSSGNFYLGGTSGSLQWAAATDALTVRGTVTAIRSMTAGEDITATIPKPIYISTGDTTSADVVSFLDIDDEPRAIYGTNWYSQSFLVPSNINRISSVKIHTRRINSPTGNMDVSLYACDVNDKPTGSILATKAILAADISAGRNYTEFEFASSLSVSPSTKHCIVCSVPSGTGTNWISWYHNESQSGYANGEGGYSTDSGSNWTGRNDFGFYVAGYYSTEKGNVLLCDDNDTERLAYTGFAVTTATATNNTDVQFSDILDGFSGLSIGSTYYLNTLNSKDLITFSLQSTDNVFGETSTYEKRGQTITWVADSYYTKLKSIKLYLFKTGTPTDNLIVKVYSSDKTTLLATSATIDGSTLTASASEYEFTFATTFTAVDATEYFFSIERSDSVDSSNYYNIDTRTNDDYAGGSLWSYNGSTWTEFSGGDYDAKFIIVAQPDSISGIISSAPGTNSVKVGRAISDTEILIYQLAL